MVDREPSRSTPDNQPQGSELPLESASHPMDFGDALDETTVSEGVTLDSELSEAINQAIASQAPASELLVEGVELVSASVASSNLATAGKGLAAKLAGEAAASKSAPAKTAPSKSAAQKSAPSVQDGAAAAAAGGQAKVASESSTDQPATKPVSIFNRFALLKTMPSWLVSMMLHVAILMTLAAIQIEPVRDAIGIMMTAVSNEEAPGIEDSLEMSAPLNEVPAAAASADAALATSSDVVTSQEMALPDTSSLASPMEIAIDGSKIGSIVDSVVPSTALNASAGRLSSSLAGRGSGAKKSEMLERFGGNAASEKSVALALQWLADHQDRSGGWTFAHSAICRGKCEDNGDIPDAVNAATALALLPFLGAGQTHIEGKYKTTVQKGLNFLISRMQVTKGDLPRGSWHEKDGSMYSHGLASIVVCEAYAMTRDPGLLQPAQLAINYTLYAQDPNGGGWRYEPKQPGDTSVVGWQLMALKSGVMGNLTVPSDTFRLANGFLDRISVNDGAYYGYDQATSNIEGRQATTAVGLLCRMYLGWSKDRPGMKEGVQYLAKRGPDVNDLYYSYYATQVMRQHGGAEWEAWNRVMRDSLIKSQVTTGHAAGSWYTEGGHSVKGGRLYCTALSTMILEVYYRHMPLYSEKSSDEEFEF